MKSSAEKVKVVYYAPKDIRVEPFGEIPQIGKEEVLIKVEACAICGSDIKTYLNGNPRMRPMAVIGHELCGEIIKAGENVVDYSVGQRVTMATTMGCGECYYCLEGKPNICMNVEAMGFHCDGAMASYTVIPQKAIRGKNLVPVGDLEAEIACLSEPMSCAVNSVTMVPVEKLKSALVIGIGALGMFHAITLREYGVKNIVCVSDAGTKRDIMESMGFKVVDRKEIDEKYLSLSDGIGFDLVAITSPSNKVQSEAPKYARKSGYVSYFASLPVGDHEITINSRTLHYGELRFYGVSDSTPAHVKEAVRILTKYKDDIKRITTKLPITDFQEGVDGIIEKRYAKVVLIP
jgi:L-iditol 2-dehydrogenase